MGISLRRNLDGYSSRDWATSPTILSAVRSYFYGHRRGQCGVLSTSRLFVFPVADFSSRVYLQRELVLHRRLSLWAMAIPCGFFPIFPYLIREPVFATLLFPFDAAAAGRFPPSALPSSSAARTTTRMLGR